MQTQSHKDTWETYTACWAESNQNARINMLQNSLSPDCHYTDINTETKGITNLAEYMTGFQIKFPSAKFVTTDFKEHHNQSLAHWNMVDQDGKTIGQGASYAFYENGKLKMMTGFFEQ
ncbi:MAG: nuclear transport factor 2 family protein [Bacteroidetes bacterium]|nr:nuclear transport factor 2 family protein [Bacteroidota bacterium]